MNVRTLSLITTVAVSATSFEAAAQAPASPAILVLALGPPAAVSLAIDIALLVSLGPDGYVGRGRGITGTVFAGIGIGLSALCLSVGLANRGSDPAWNLASGGVLAFEFASMALAIFALLRGEAPEEQPLVPPPPPPVPPLTWAPMGISGSATR